MGQARLSEAEGLRTPDSMCAPDPRTAVPGGGARLSLDAHHAVIAAIQLNPAVPETVAIQFETARNLYLYAWHVYRFYMAAAAQALSSLEFGLRECLPARLPEPYQKPWQKQPMLAGLLGYAIAQGLVRNEGFRRWHAVAAQEARDRRRTEALQALMESNLESVDVDKSEPIQITPEDRAWDLVAVLRQSLSYLRNELAHGSAMLTPQVSGTLELVAEVLNQLYSPPSDPKPAS
jgi:hypothetical protein